MQGGNIGIDENKQPDVDWMVAVIATLDPFNEIFEKSYVGKKRTVHMGHVLNNSDNFFTILPLSRSKKSQHTRILWKTITK